jgi:hypothetical protein
MVSSAETLGALKWGFDTVNLNRPTSCEWRHSAGTGGEERLVGFENDDDRRPAEDDSRAADGDAFDFLSLTGSRKQGRTLVNFSAQPEPIVTREHTLYTP